MNVSPNTSIAASIDGPIFPVGVESNVLQYLIPITFGCKGRTSSMASAVFAYAAECARAGADLALQPRRRDARKIPHTVLNARPSPRHRGSCNGLRDRPVIRRVHPKRETRDHQYGLRPKSARHVPTSAIEADPTMPAMTTPLRTIVVDRPRLIIRSDTHPAQSVPDAITKYAIDPMLVISWIENPPSLTR